MKKKKLTTDVLTANYSGLFGNKMLLVNRQGKSILTIPRKRPKRAPSERQANVRKMFALAAHYAKNALENPDMLAAYTAKSREGLSPYVVAMTDYLRPPYVQEIITVDYTGKPGSKIHVVADDDFGIAEVAVTILDASGTEIETGNCVQDMLTGNYDYTAASTIDTLAGVEIVAVARDFPGHMAEYAVTL